MLISYGKQKIRPQRGLLLLMAIVHQNKLKVCPVMDYRELNLHVDAYTTDADVCTRKLREWRSKVRINA